MRTGMAALAIQAAVPCGEPVQCALVFCMLCIMAVSAARFIYPWSAILVAEICQGTVTICAPQSMLGRHHVPQAACCPSRVAGVAVSWRNGSFLCMMAVHGG